MSRVYTWDGSFELLSGETLLEGLERQGYVVEYQCRAGYCGSCRTPLVDGQVEYLIEPLAYINPDEVLPCCCRPAPEARVDVEVLTNNRNRSDEASSEAWDESLVKLF
ncbi:class I ribonucleotide reductase maintenance protein YfaE [Oligella urethralis]|uniref:class I ribonucleotide reductase maintenance protein YfaE n=1 Tax=Oligella urethralis TaxID=90245 RepID=UPI00254C98C8|nr:class I ribonucleotide reductase maintenance protein YfaE [Oligella urethralis]MDK6202073.1 class I ribonucleotide reductase maintenance protein YfaE [Oligella urethralis]